MNASTRTELGACARCYLDDEGGTGWHLCPDHAPDRRPRSHNVEAHLAQARAVLATHQLELGVDE